uniref:DUF1758 domain-containing protein n=2 Tax=Loa loa TaxID=7209 RepID=A0A1I7VZM2_LOALO
MTSSIIASIEPAKNRLVFLLNEINSLVFESPDPNSSYEQRENLYTARIQVLADKIDRIQLCIKSLKEAYEMWLSYIQTITTKKREEEKVFESILEGEQGLFRVIHEGQEAIITLTRRKNEIEQKLEGILKVVKKEQEIIIPSPNHTVQLPQLSLPTFNGDPRQWRQFWSSFDAAVHSQTIPDIQKLNYLFSCLKGEALQAVSGYEIAPENYGIIRQLLKNKYGDPSTIASILYRELQSFKQNEKEWMITIENIERVLRQLEALGDNLEHPSIETIIESKMPPRILNKVCTQRKIDKPWTIQKLRNFLSDLVEVNQQVKIDQYSNFRADSKPTTIKGEQKRMYRPERTSALSTMQTNHRETRSPTSRKRPCIFCSRDHWDSDCDIYSTASHNSALCEKRSTPTLNITTLPKKHESIYPDKKESPVLLYHSTGEPQTNKAKNILLLCKEIGVFNPVHPQKQRRALALFDIGPQLSFISKKLSSQLQLAESDHRNMLVAPFGTKEPLQCPTANAQLSICTVDNEIITINTHVVEYLTQEIRVVDIPVKKQCEDLTSHWDKPDILIGADCFFKFVDSQDKKELRSGYIMVHSKVGPMITGEGYIDELCDSKGHSIPIICSVYTNLNSELEKFWRLEMIGIHESPTEDDDERAIDHFNKTIIKLDGRYEVCWSWKDSKQRLSNNYGLCIGRLKNLVRRLNSSSHLHDYDNTIKDQLLKGVIEEVNETCELDETESERSITNRIQEVTDSPTNYNKVKGKEIEVTDGPIASRTRKAQQQSTPAGNTVKDNSNSLTKALFVMTILSLMSTQAIATKNCNWTSGIPFSIPERWSCDNKTNHTMINLNCGFNNSYLMKKNIILDVNNNIDDKSIANLNQTQETTKRLLLMEISLEETFNQKCEVSIYLCFSQTRIHPITLKMSGNYPTLAAEMLQQRNDVIARRDSRLGQLLVAPCKTNGITLKNIEFSGGLKGKFEIERINAELEL